MATDELPLEIIVEKTLSRLGFRFLEVTSVAFPHKKPKSLLDRLTLRQTEECPNHNIAIGMEVGTKFCTPRRIQLCPVCGDIKIQKLTGILFLRKRPPAAD